jgi:hypothetical protein
MAKPQTLKHNLGHYCNNQDDLIDELVDLLGEDGNFAIGIRGMYETEKNKLRQSYVWIDGNKTRQKLPGTSCLGIVSNWGDANNQDLIDGLKNIGKSAMYGDGRFAIIKGQYDVNVQDDWANDPGEYVLLNAEIVAYTNHDN